MKKQIILPEEIDENCILPEIQIEPGEKLQLDLQAVRLMNSFGVRNWSRWLLPVLKTNAIEFIHVPMMLLSLSSIVQSVFPEGSLVSSFSLNYRNSKNREIQLFFESQEGIFNVPEQLYLTGEHEPYELEGLTSRLFTTFADKVKLHPQLDESELKGLKIQKK